MKTYITVTEGMAGFFAVQMWWNDEDQKIQFWEPYDTGLGRYRNIENAIDEAMGWANDEKIAYVKPGERYDR